MDVKCAGLWVERYAGSASPALKSICESNDSGFALPGFPSFPVFVVFQKVCGKVGAITTHIDDIRGRGEQDPPTKIRAFSVYRFRAMTKPESSSAHVGMDLVQEKESSVKLTKKSLRRICTLYLSLRDFGRRDKRYCRQKISIFATANWGNFAKIQPAQTVPSCNCAKCAGANRPLCRLSPADRPNCASANCMLVGLGKLRQRDRQFVHAMRGLPLA